MIELLKTLQPDSIIGIVLAIALAGLFVGKHLYRWLTQIRDNAAQAYAILKKHVPDIVALLVNIPLDMWSDQPVTATAVLGLGYFVWKFAKDKGIFATATAFIGKWLGYEDTEAWNVWLYAIYIAEVVARVILIHL